MKTVTEYVVTLRKFINNPAREQTASALDALGNLEGASTLDKNALRLQRERADESLTELGKAYTTIKALADALMEHGWACRVTLRGERPECECVGCRSARALRLAGRLP